MCHEKIITLNRSHVLYEDRENMVHKKIAFTVTSKMRTVNIHQLQRMNITKHVE